MSETDRRTVTDQGIESDHRSGIGRGIESDRGREIDHKTVTDQGALTSRGTESDNPPVVGYRFLRTGKLLSSGLTRCGANGLCRCQNAGKI